MPEFLVIGFRHSFGTKRSGEQYDDYIVFCTRDAIATENEVGQAVEIVRIPATLFCSKPVSVGDVISPAYNRTGDVIAY